MVPISRHVAVQLTEPPEGVDRSLWLYELCRFLTMKVNNLIIAFFAENPPCSAQTCPEMRASEWQYLCAVHDPPKSCCAIDYCCHTLDWATNTLTSPKYFPSRLTLGSEAGGGPQASMRHLTNIFRRLYRIFAHAWFQHRDVFWEVEGHDGLYVFFKTVCDMFHLIPEDNYTIPPEAEGPDALLPKADEATDVKRLTILKKENENPFSSELDGVESSLGTGATTRRHKHSPSTGSRVTTITESAEDNEDLHLSSAAPLREVLKDSPEPRPPSAVENRPADEEPGPELQQTSTEETPAAEAVSEEAAEEAPEENTEATEASSEEKAEPIEEPKEEPEQPEQTPDEAETAAEPESKDTEQADTTEVSEPEAQAETETEAEKPLEGSEETPAPTSEDGPSEPSPEASEAKEPEAEATAEPESKTEE